MVECCTSARFDGACDHTSKKITAQRNGTCDGTEFGGLFFLGRCLCVQVSKSFTAGGWMINDWLAVLLDKLLTVWAKCSDGGVIIIIGRILARDENGGNSLVGEFTTIIIGVL